MKIALLIPCYRDPAFQFAASLGALLIHTARVRPELELATIWRQCSLISHSRNLMMNDAIAGGVDAVLMLDSDHQFPPDTLLRLLDHELEVVGTNPAARREPTGPTAANIRADGTAEPVWTTMEKAAAGAVERVDRIGLGLVLVRLSVLAKLRAAGQLVPLFHFRLNDDGSHLTGEDYFFCERLEAAGVPIHVDHRLSWEVGHVIETMLFPADAERVRLGGAGRETGQP